MLVLFFNLQTKNKKNMNRIGNTEIHNKIIINSNDII